MLENVRIAGGTAAISEEVATAVATLTGGSTGDANGDRSHGTFVSVGEFEVLPGIGAPYEDVTGTATMTRTVHGTTEVEVLVEGMPANTFAPVHVHVGSCEERGGDHFQFEVGGSVMPPNEIHPRFTSDAAGVGRGTMTAFAIAGNDARSVVIHDPNGVKVACAELGGPEIPADAVTMPQLASFMAPDPVVGAEGVEIPWVWYAVGAWILCSLLLGWVPRRRARALAEQR